MDDDQAVEFETVFRREQPTVMISDYSMRGLDGIAVLSAARRRNPETRRCLCSGSLDEVSAAEREAIAPCFFLRKPWAPALLDALLGIAES